MFSFQQKMSCSICLDDLEEEKEKLDCNHEFHKKCISEWFKRRRICPLCRSPEIAIPKNVEIFIEKIEFAGEIDCFKKCSDFMYEVIFRERKDYGVLQINQNGTATISCTRAGKKILNVIS
jgi:hypothetical protein